MRRWHAWLSNTTAAPLWRSIFSVTRRRDERRKVTGEVSDSPEARSGRERHQDTPRSTTLLLLGGLCAFASSHLGRLTQRRKVRKAEYREIARLAIECHRSAIPDIDVVERAGHLHALNTRIRQR